jgi:hypothetical protein
MSVAVSREQMIADFANKVRSIADEYEEIGPLDLQLYVLSVDKAELTISCDIDFGENVNRHPLSAL